MVGVFASNAVDRGFEPRSGQTKDYKTGICCFSAKHAALRRMIKDWLTWNQVDVSEWGDMSIRAQLFQRTSTVKNLTKRVGIIHNRHYHLIENQLVLTMI